MTDETMRPDDDGTTDAATTDAATTTDRVDGGTAGADATTTAVDDAFVKVPDTERATADQDSSRDAPGGDDSSDALLDRDRAEAFRRRWEDIQAGFVDRPRDSVEQADRLVVEVVQQLQASFTLARERLEADWSDGADASTEDLRVALRRYRSFFDRLLST